MRPVAREDSTFVLGGSNTDAGMALVDYAARYFSDHLSESDPADGDVLDSLVQFLESDGVLSWMALAARDGDMRRLAKVSAHLQQYLDRRLELPESDTEDPRWDLIRQWGIDLLRFSSRFGLQLSTSPGSLFDQIPSLCPPGTAIAKAFRRYQPSILSRTSKSAPSTTWGPILASTGYGLNKCSSPAYGCNLFALVFSSTTRVYKVKIYDHESTQWMLDLPLPSDPANSEPYYKTSLTFSTDDQYLAVYHQSHIYFYEPLAGTLIYNYPLQRDQPPQTVDFTTAEKLIVVTQEDITCIEWYSCKSLAKLFTFSLNASIYTNVTAVIRRKGQPGNQDVIRQVPLPDEVRSGGDWSNWNVGVAADKDKWILVFASKDVTIPVVL